MYSHRASCRVQLAHDIKIGLHQLLLFVENALRSFAPSFSLLYHSTNQMSTMDNMQYWSFGVVLCFREVAVLRTPLSHRPVVQVVQRRGLANLQTRAMIYAALFAGSLFPRGCSLQTGCNKHLHNIAYIQHSWRKFSLKY